MQQSTAPGEAPLPSSVPSSTSTSTPTSTSTSTSEYLQAWGSQRCGNPLPDVQRAWSILANTTYRAGVGTGLGHRYCSNVNPGNSAWANAGGGWSSVTSFWQGGYTHADDVNDYASQLFEAWVLLTNAAGECDTDTLRFDIADVGREWLQT